MQPLQPFLLLGIAHADHHLTALLGGIAAERIDGHGGGHAQVGDGAQIQQDRSVCR